MPDKKSNKKKWMTVVIAVLFIIATIIISLGRDNKNTISVETEKVSYKAVVQKVNALSLIHI